MNILMDMESYSPKPLLFIKIIAQRVKRKQIILLAMFLFITLALFSQTKKNDGKISITLLQINDVYEISPLDSGRVGGLARVATVRKKLLRENSNTFTLLAGDFVSPSAIGTLQYDDMKMGGRQMVNVLNATGVDLVTFGNHEFDLGQPELQRAIDTSTFDWVSTNVKPLYASGYLIKRRNKKKVPIPPVYIKQFKDADGTTVKIGFIGLTLESGAGKKYIEYEDFLIAAGDAIDSLEKKCDFIIGLTHLAIDQDIELAKKYPKLKMIIGGHEHANSDTTIGKVRILKADANVKTVYEHFVVYKTKEKQFSVKSKLEPITDAIANDATVQKEVDYWNTKATELLRKQKKCEPCAVIAKLPKAFDGTENSVRTTRTDLTLTIADAMMQFAVDSGLVADCAIYNSGGIRLDDSLKGFVTNYDLFRVLPYQTIIRIDTLKGSLMTRLLDTGYNNPKEGCFLQYNSKLTRDTVLKKWKLGENFIDENRDYLVVMNTYLSEGNQDKMEFMGKENNRRGKKTADLLLLLSQYLQSKFTVIEMPQQRNTNIPCY